MRLLRKRGNSYCKGSPMPPSRSVDVAAPVRVILDCDTKNEVDDQLAIAYALGSTRIEVVGVISVQNTLASVRGYLEMYLGEAERIVALSGRVDVSGVRGASLPLED